MKAQTVKHVVRFVFTMWTPTKDNTREEQVDYAKPKARTRQLISDYGYEFINWNTNAFNNVRIDLKWWLAARFVYRSFPIFRRLHYRTVAVRHGKVSSLREPLQVPEGCVYRQLGGRPLCQCYSNLTLTPVFEPEYEITIYDEAKLSDIFYETRRHDYCRKSSEFNRNDAQFCGFV